MIKSQKSLVKQLLYDLITEQLPQFVTLGLDILMALGGAIIENLPIIIDSAMQM